MTSPRKCDEGSNQPWAIAAAIVALILGVMLSRALEPGVRVENVTFAEGTPALKFIPAGRLPMD